MRGPTTTTITVPAQLRERVQQHAQRAQVSQASVLEHALDLLEREEFFTRLRRDVTERPEDEVVSDERETWLGGPVAVTSDGTGE